MTQNLPHSPVWADLSAPDQERAETFYGGLLGWTFDNRGADFGGYSIAMKDGNPIAGIMSSQMQPPEGVLTDDAPEDVPPAWTVYLGTDNIEDSVHSAQAAGATVIMPPMQVPGSGTMALIIDPAGATVGLWQASEFGGTTLAEGDHGHFAWFETMNNDYPKSVDFYRDALQWQITPMDDDEDDFRYATNGAGYEASAGIGDTAMFSEASPSFWRVYFGVENTDQALKYVRENGGKVLAGPDDTPFGRVATCEDDQGVLFMVVS